MNHLLKIPIHSDDKIQKVLLKELVNQGIAQISDAHLIIQPELLYSLLPTDRMLLGISSFYPFTLEITSDMNIYKQDSKLYYSFKEHEYGNYLIYDLYENLLIKNNMIKYILPKELFNICKLIDRYNHSSKENTQKYKILSRIIQLSKENDIILPPSLKDIEIEVVNNIILDIKRKSDKTNVELLVKAKSSDKSTSTEIDMRKIAPQSNFAKIKQNCSVKRLYFDDSIRNIINKINKINNAPDPLKIKLISKIDSDPDFDSNIVDLSVFSNRVVEYGYYQPKYFALVKSFKSNWLPGFSVDNQDKQELVYITNENERINFEDLINQSVEAKKDFVEYNNHIIPLLEAEKLNSFFKKQLSNPKTKPSNKEYKVLIIEENIDELKYDEKPTDLSETDLLFCPPPNLRDNVSLLEHQKEGIAWLKNISINYKGCLLADDMGLGKTLQILSFLDIYAFQEQKDRNSSFLIIAPISLLENWQNEYKKFFYSKLKIILVNSQTKFEQYNSKNLQKTIMLTNYETIRNPKNQLFFGKIKWDVVVIDEAQKIKTPGTRITTAIKALNAYFKIAMTGTPVENTLLDLWCIVDFTTPGLLGSAKKFKNDFDKPLQDSFTKETLDLVGSNLRKSLGKSFKRRLKKNTLELSLPPKKIFIKKYEMPEVQRNMYMEEITQKEEDIPILSIIHNLRNISDHPYLKHYDLTDFSNEELIKVSAKTIGTIEILTEIRMRNEKVIIFTEFRKIQYMLRKILLEYFSLNDIYIINGLTASSEKKNKDSRQSIINKFSKMDGFQIIIMSPIAAGVGLNIISANNVIHYTRHWNPAKESQATDRVYRIGQSKRVNIYYPMSILSDYKTFDIILDELLKKKTQLSDYTMFPTPISEVKINDFMNVIDFPSKEIISKNLQKNELMKLANNYLQSFLVLALQNRFKNVYLLSEQNNKGIDIIGMEEISTKENYLFKIIHPKHNISNLYEKDLLAVKNYFNYTFNKNFRVILISSKEIKLSNDITILSYNNLLETMENVDISLKDLDKINQNRLTNLSEIKF